MCNEYGKLEPGCRAYGIHRGVLFRAMQEAVATQPVDVRLGCEIVSREIAGDGVYLTDACGGRHGPLDFVIAGDGSRSRVRTAGVGDALRPRHALAHRARHDRPRPAAARRPQHAECLWDAIDSAVTFALSPFFQSDWSLLGLGRDAVLPVLPEIPWIRRQMLLTVAGLKGGFLKGRELI